MIYERKNDLAIGPHHFLAYVFLPGSSTLSEGGRQSPGQLDGRYLSRDGRRYAAISMCADPARNLSVCMIHHEMSGPPQPDACPAVIEEIAERAASLLTETDPEDLVQSLALMAQRSGEILSAAVLTVDADLQEAEGEGLFAVARFVAAGLPPVVLIENAHYQFPVRSGIPLGVNDMVARAQTIEIPVHSSLYLHTPLIGGTAELRRLHSRLARFRAEELPDETILFGLTLRFSHD